MGSDAWIKATLKSDHIGIEIQTQDYSLSVQIKLKSDHIGIEI